MPPAIRRAEPRDAERLAELAHATFRETFLEDFAIPYPPDDLAVFVAATYTAAAFADILADPSQAAWLVEAEDGRACAYATAGPCSLPHPQARPEHGELKRLYVRRTHQGSGLGLRVFDAALSWLGQVYDGPKWIGVWSGNLKAQRFYDRHGFAKVGECDFPVGEWRDREFILRKG